MLSGSRSIGFYIAIISFVALPIIIGLLMINMNKPPEYSISGETFYISTAFGQNVKLSDIESVQLKNELPQIGSKINGLGIGSIYKGQFSSGIGVISLYVDTDIPQYVYVKTASKMIIFNYQSIEKTQDIFNKLNTEINNK